MCGKKKKRYYKKYFELICIQIYACSWCRYQWLYLHCTCKYLRKTLTLSHLSAHVVNRPLRENRKSIPKFFNSKKTFF